MKIYYHQTFLNENFNQNQDEFENALQNYFPEVTNELIEILQDCNMEVPEEVNASLEKLEILLEGYGLESLRSPDFWSQYWDDMVAKYIIRGDENHPTIIFDIIDERFVCTSLQEWIEYNQNLGFNIK
jgi:hypothetical protein